MPALSMHDVARLEEARAARVQRHVPPEHREIAGGVMGRGVPGLWYNYAVNVAMHGPISAAEFDELLHYYIPNRIEPRIEVAPYVDPSLIALCRTHGFVVAGFETVLFRPVESRPASNPSAITIERVPKDDAARLRDLAIRSIVCFSSPDHTPSDAEIAGFLASVHQPDTILLEARIDGQSAGLAAMEAGPEVAALFGASTWPQFRRRGVQAALIEARMALAAQHGARIATIGSRPGVATERNVRRVGFQVAYTKMALSKPGPGLTPVPW